MFRDGSTTQLLDSKGGAFGGGHTLNVVPGGSACHIQYKQKLIRLISATQHYTQSEHAHTHTHN